jgi:hypothetical protein
MLTKKPISPSSSLELRPAIGVPTATSSCPLQRDSVIWKPASTAMNKVAPRPAAIARNDRVTSGVTSNPIVSVPERTNGRGRSAANSNAARPAKRPRQYPN